ncbi:MAG TPA: hypothetical protein VIN59_06215 [Alphaproteobacteria bacterium]
MAQTLRRLSEQDLAQLYLQTEAPLKLDALLQGQEKGDIAQIAVHDAMRSQTPDLALVSLSLCALIIARDFPRSLKDGPYGPVIRELAFMCEDNLLTVGRLWIDTVVNGILPDPKADKETILSIPDRLRVMTSIYMELRDALDDEDPSQALMFQAVNALYYQAESHSDLADIYVENLTAPKRKTQTTSRARDIPDQIPLPFELHRPQQGAEVVSFSLFRKR